MININRMNLFMVGLPPILIGFGRILNFDILIAGLLFTMVTGGFQIIVAIGIFIESGYKNKFFAVYLILTLLFFSLMALTDWKWIMGLPPLLAVYMTVLLILEAKKERHENIN